MVFEVAFLHYDEPMDEVFCHMCLMACKLNRMKTRNVDPAFVSFYSFQIIG